MTPTRTYWSRKVERAERLDQSWRAAAACAGHDTATFFPTGSGATPPDYGPALAVCAGCPVMGPCHEWAVAAGEIVDGHAEHGQVIGGVAPERKRNGKPYKREASRRVS